jgi:hypothetical protein
VSNVINFGEYEDAGLGCDIRDFLLMPPNTVATPKAVGKRLKKHVGEPVRSEGETLALKGNKGRDGEMVYYVKATKVEE